MIKADIATLRHEKQHVSEQMRTCRGGCDAQHRSDGAGSSILGAQGVLINDAVEGQDESGPGEVADEMNVQTMSACIAEP